MTVDTAGGPRVRIGYEEFAGRANYATARNCYAPTPGVRFERVPRLPVDVLDRHGGVGDAVFVPARPMQLAGMHLWNRVSFGRLPWGVSVESMMPRLLRHGQRSRPMQVLRRRLMSEQCRFIAPISDWATSVFLGTLSDSERAVLQPKTHRLYPFQAVDPRLAAVEPPSSDLPLRVCFVGSEFFRKGGEALVRALDIVGDELDIHATVISALRHPDYATRGLDAAQVAAVRERVAAHARVTWHAQLPNTQVLETMRQSHLGVLPTLSETFGYALLEFMSRGRPVVGTNVQAGPEIVASDRGWCLEVDVRTDGQWRGRGQGASAYHDAVATLTEQLVQVFREVRANPHELARRGAAAAEHIRTRYEIARAERAARLYALVR